MTNYDFNQLFIKCSSPAMCGIKPSNLFTVSSDCFSDVVFKRWEQMLSEQGLSVSTFRSSSNTTMVFVYDMAWIRRILKEPLVAAYLNGKEYFCTDDADRTLKQLFFRLQTDEAFPHEVGIFLGYPVEDVINFEENQGRCCKYCGYWKSYCNPEEAKKCCDRYRQCSRICRQWFDEGFSIPQIIRKYKEMVLEVA